MRTALTLLLLIVMSPCYAKLYPAFSARNFYVDEIDVAKTYPDEPYSWFNPYVIRVKWNGTVLADDVHFLLTDDMLKPNRAYNWDADKSRISYVFMDGVLEMKKIKPACFNQSDSVKYPYRIVSYVNTRQMAEILKASGNRLILLERGARDSARVLIDNLHADYPCIHVIEQPDGWTFAEP